VLLLTPHERVKRYVATASGGKNKYHIGNRQ
jgi:hypothetical protein